MFKQLIKHILSLSGYVPVRKSFELPWVRRNKLLNYYGIELVIDIGANAGQYAGSLWKNGYKERIISFEPLSSVYKVLLNRASGNHLWDTYNMALGDIDGEVEINVSENTLSSSVLDMLPEHVQSAPESRYVGKEIVKIRRLDTVFGEIVKDESNVFLKIDVQGFEKKVLEGASEVLRKIIGIQMELSLVPLYQAETTLIPMLELMRDMNYELVGIEPGFTHPESGRLLQADCIFIRDS